MGGDGVKGDVEPPWQIFLKILYIKCEETQNSVPLLRLNPPPPKKTKKKKPLGLILKSEK